MSIFIAIIPALIALLGISLFIWLGIYLEKRNTKKCPHCKERINKDASKCKHCQSTID